MGLGSFLGRTLGGIAGAVVGSWIPGAGTLGIGLGSALGDSIGSGIDAKNSNADSIRAQQEMAKYQAELEQANWEKRFNMQNEYNDPSAMRDRLENAGMNPNLAYGSLSPNMAANPHASAPTGQLSKYQTAYEMSIQQQQIRNETMLAQSQAEKNAAEAKVAEVRAEREEIGRDVDMNTKDFKIKYEEFLSQAGDRWNREMGIQEYRNELEAMKVTLGFDELAFKKEKQKQDYQIGMMQARAAMIHAGAAATQANAAVKTANALAYKMEQEGFSIEIQNNANQQPFVKVPYRTGNWKNPIGFKWISVAEYAALVGAHRQTLGAQQTEQDIEYRPFEFMLDATSAAGNMYLKSKGVGPASQMETTYNYDKRGNIKSSTVRKKITR